MRVVNLKQLAAAKAVEFVESGMVLGLGTGSTTRYAIEMIGERLRDGRLGDIVGSLLGFCALELVIRKRDLDHPHLASSPDKAVRTIVQVLAESGS